MPLLPPVTAATLLYEDMKVMKFKKKLEREIQL